MSDPLHPLTALMGAAPVVERIGALRIAEEPNVALASVAARRGRAAEVAATGGALIHADWPGVERAAGDGPIRAFWTGPEQWMLTAAYDGDADLAATAKAAFGDAASVTEQADAWVWFAVTGEDVDEILARLCAVDVQRRAPDVAIRTVFAQIGGFLLRGARDDGAAVLGPRSSAESLHRALIDAARSVAQIRAAR